MAGMDFTGYEDLFNKIKVSKVSLESCANPREFLYLPFPFLGPPFPEKGSDGRRFYYMGRQKFAELVHMVNRFENPDGCHTLYFYGTTGYGKSYILAALSCLLMREGKRVVYIPTCRGLLQAGFGHYLTWALFLCFGDSPIQQREIECCQNDPEELIRYCRQLSKRKVLLYFFIDQYNGLHLVDENMDDISNERKACSEDWLLKATYGHCLIKCVTADNHAAIHRAKKHRDEIDMAIYGGFTEASSLPSCPEVSKRDVARDGVLVEALYRTPPSRHNRG